MTNTDLVVVLPGIMGSTLTHNGSPVWAPSAGAALRALFTLGRNLDKLTLPEGLGDADPHDGVEPGDLMPDLHVIPGVWSPITGYDALLRRLRQMRDTGTVGTVLPVAYDWRLSNRRNGERLAGIVVPALARWRASSPERADARLVFVCHSMGGLVARWYLERCDGAEVTRMLITIGTPYRGAAKAVDQLVNGVRKKLGPLAVDLTRFAQSMPSLHQLLPDYACIDAGGRLHRLDETTVPGLDTAMAGDGLRFHATLAAAEAARPASLEMAHAIIGVDQPTPTTLQPDGDGVRAQDTIGADNDYGDGTVPLTGAIGHDQPMSTNRVRRVADQHGHLQTNARALDELESVLTAKPIRRRAAEELSVRVAGPDVIVAGEPLTVAIEIGADRPPAVRVALVAERRPGEPERVVASRTPAIRRGRADTTFTDLAPGGYEVRVTGINPGSPISPVTLSLLVWAPQP